MKKSWKPSGVWVTGLGNKVRNDVFAAAQLKVVLLYFLMGIVILGAAGYFVYSRVVLIVEHLLRIAMRLIASRSAVNAPAVAALIGRSISQEIQGMDVSIALWLSLVIVLAAVLFAGITLWPIGNTMERQRRLIGNVSHELKTPLSVMKTNAEVTLMDAQAFTEDALAAALKANLEEIDQMSKVVQLLLNFSTLESRLKKVTMSPVDLAAVTRIAEQSARSLAAEKNIALSLVISADPRTHLKNSFSAEDAPRPFPSFPPEGRDSPKGLRSPRLTSLAKGIGSFLGRPQHSSSEDPALPAENPGKSLRPIFEMGSRKKQWVVQGNAQAIEEMTAHILRNAFAYTPAHGLVTLSLVRDGHSIVLSVEDTSGGIAEEDLPHIFEPFNQGMSAANSNQEANATFGLVIAKEIAATHRAIVSVVSEVGKGTRFSVKFRGM